MNASELLIEVKETYDISSEDMCFLYAKDGKPIRDTTMSAWLSGKKLPPDNVVDETPQKHEDIAWLASYIEAHPELDRFTYAHFKAAINSLDTTETL